MSASPEIEEMISLLARLPGLGPRSARRAALALIRKRGALLEPLAGAMTKVAGSVRDCVTCGNITSGDQCEICTDPKRANGEICIVETVADLWAMERAAAFRGRYHVLGGLLSALDGIGPDELRIPALKARVENEMVREVILALPATMDGQTTAHYLAGELAGVKISSLAQGVPIGGELDYLDDGTIGAAMLARKAL